MDDEDFDIRPGRSRDTGARSYGKARTLVGRVVTASRKAGHLSLQRGQRQRGTGHRGRGRRAAVARRGNALRRRVIVKARVVRHRGTRYRAAPLARHVAYLEREGVTRDGSDAKVFDAGSEVADGDAFAARCGEDRHHFRFIISPEDALDMGDLREFTRELLEDMAKDLDTRLDWIAVDHWNTDNPHVHVLVRGTCVDGSDLVIDRGYISAGLRGRAEERATAELGPRSERDIRNALAREVEAERWTSLDRRLAAARDIDGCVDLRPDSAPASRKSHSFLIGRAQMLERLGLAEPIGPATWRLKGDFEQTLRALGERGDIIKTMHRAMRTAERAEWAGQFALHDHPGEQVIGRLVTRGLHDELTGEAYAVVEGVDGRAHHLRFADLDRTGDAKPGAIVQTGSWTDRRGRPQASLLVRSDFTLEQQIEARGATWLDRQLVSPRPERLAGTFGEEVQEALERRTGVLLEEGLARRQSGRVFFARNLLAELQKRDLAQAAETLAAKQAVHVRTPSTEGTHVSGVYRERADLASGRFAVIDNGAEFQLVPWRQDLERHLGEAVSGRVNSRGGVDWSFAKARGLAL